jgi:hypothetical protein
MEAAPSGPMARAACLLSAAYRSSPDKPRTKELSGYLSTTSVQQFTVAGKTQQ